MCRTVLLVAGLFLLLVLLSVCGVSEGKKKKSTSTSNPKTTTSTSSTSSHKKDTARLETLNSILMRSTQVIPLTDRNFSKFITERPRTYNSLVTLTATAAQYSCNMCVKAKVNYDEASRLYHSQYNFSTVPPEQRLVFFSVEVDDARNLFGELRIETVPRIYFVPAADVDSFRMQFSQQEIESRALLEGVTPMLELINEVAKIKVQILIDPSLVLVMIGILALFLALFISSASNDLYSTLFFYQSPSLWSVVSVIAFGVGVSGSIFCIIRSAPYFGYSRQGKMAIFAPQGRDQYLIEGIIVSLWTVGCGLCFYLMQLSTKLRFPVLRHILVLLFLTAFVVLATEIWSAYVAKTAWYSLKETVPGEVWFFLTSAVKKNSGLLKRLVRVSEIWLFEVKKYEDIYKKFNLLVVDYVKKRFQLVVAAKNA